MTRGGADGAGGASADVAASIRYIQNRYPNVNNIPNIFTGTQGNPDQYYTGY